MNMRRFIKGRSGGAGRLFQVRTKKRCAHRWKRVAVETIKTKAKYPRLCGPKRGKKGGSGKLKPLLYAMKQGTGGEKKRTGLGAPKGKRNSLRPGRVS